MMSTWCTHLACDGVEVKILEQYDMMETMAKYDLVQNFTLLSVSDVRAKVSVGIVSLANILLYSSLNLFFLFSSHTTSQWRKSFLIIN